MPAKAPLHFWEFPQKQWSRLHIDHAGPFLGKYFFVLINAYSKCLEVHIVNSTSSEVTIQKLQQIFFTHGLPEQIVSDNGPVFTSHEFKNYMKQCGIHHIRTSPYHPSSNGLAERAVQTFKSFLKKLEGNVKTRLFTFLARYQVTPHSTTELSPAELLMGRKLRTTLDLMHPDVSRKVTTKLSSSSSRKPPHTFSVGDKVFARNYHGTKIWLPAEIVQVAGPVSYKVKTSSNLILRRHIDQLRTRYGHSNEDTVTHNDLDNWTFPSSIDSNTFTPTTTLSTNSPPAQSQPVCRSS